jgi:hypothetical protein
MGNKNNEIPEYFFIPSSNIDSLAGETKLLGLGGV